ncbi:MAG TPA: NADH-quinone oxidoreductase subunit A [Ignavibacteria bacterium]|nr:NADH-quinone oxidoreductase subunit A [Ignavibacteria bacterium]
MLTSYIPILIIGLFAVIFAVVMVKFTVFFGPRNPNKEKESTYESGMEPIQTARERFSVKYYMVAVSFIVFDIEIVFLYPWAVSFLSLPSGEMMYSLIIALIFIFILIAGLVYEYGKGVLKWD